MQIPRQIILNVQWKGIKDLIPDQRKYLGIINAVLGKTSINILHFALQRYVITVYE